MSIPLPPCQVGAAKLQSDLTLNWGGIEGFRIAGKQGIGIIAACQVSLNGHAPLPALTLGEVIPLHLSLEVVVVVVVEPWVPWSQSEGRSGGG